MPRNGGARRARARAGRARVRPLNVVSIPRSVGSAGTVVQLRRTLDAGVLVKTVSDGGQQLGTVPSGLSDWAQLQAMFGRYRLLRVTNHFLVSGEFDATPAYPTLWVYHDQMSIGVPGSLTVAFLKQGVKPLSFGPTYQHRRFSYVPFVWTDTTFRTQVPAPQMAYQTATASAPSFSSVAMWGQNYNSTTSAANIMLLQEMLLEFSEPV